MLQLNSRFGDVPTCTTQPISKSIRGPIPLPLSRLTHRRSTGKLPRLIVEPCIKLCALASSSAGLSDADENNKSIQSSSSQCHNTSDLGCSNTLSTEPVSQPSNNNNDSITYQQMISDVLAEARESIPELPPVPWGMGRVVQVMVLWMLAYIIIGQVAVPIGLSLLGLDRDELSARGHALLHLGLDLSQLGVTLGILWGCLKQYRPRKRGFFPIKLGGWWWLVVAGCCCVFPAVDWLAQQSMTWFPVDGESVAVAMEATLGGGDWVTNGAYFAVVSVCAPIWEEVIFRGFLFTSLTRYMSPPAAIAASSLVFALCHFRMQTFLPLLVLGGVFSAVFLATGNLLPTVVAHSLWNIFVLANLMWRPS